MLERFVALVKRAGIARDASRILLFQMLGLVVTLATSVLVARTLGPEQKGMFDLYVLLLSLLVEFGLMGVPVGLLHCSMTRREALGRVHGTGVVIVLFASAAVALLTISLGALNASLFAGLPHWVPYVAIAAAPAGLYMAIWQNLLVAQNKAVVLQRFVLLFSSLNLLMVVLLFSLELLNFSNFLICSVLLSFGVAIMSFAYLRSSHGHLAFDANVAARSVRFGLPIFAGSVANFLHFKVDQLMIGAWIGLEGVGLYALSVRWAEMLFVLDSAIVTAALYRIGSSRSEESLAFAKDVMLIQLAVNIVAALCLSLFVGLGFEFIYGHEYAPSIGPIWLLIPGVIFWSAMKPLSNYLSYACGKGGMIAWFSALGLLANIVLNYVLIRGLGVGIAGAALASSISYALVSALVGVAVIRQGGLLNVSY